MKAIHKKWLRNTARSLAVLLCSALFCGCAKSAPKSSTPPASSGPPARIVSLSPNVTETLFAIGVGDRLCGATEYCNYPPEAKKIERVGGYLRPNYERILTLQPDLILALPEHVKGKEDLERLNLNVKIVDNKRVADILQSITDIGVACGASPRADALRQQLESELAAVRKRTAGKTAPRVLITIGRPVGQRGGIADVYVAGSNSFHDELLRMAGGKNVVQAPSYPMISAEGIIRMNPDVIIDLSTGASKSEDKAIYAKDWQSLQSLSAVANKRVHLLSGDHLLIPGPRFIQIIKELEEILYPTQ